MYIHVHCPDRDHSLVIEALQFSVGQLSSYNRGREPGGAGGLEPPQNLVVNGSNEECKISE